MARSITEIEADIAALVAQRRALLAVPTSGTQGKTTIDLSGKRGEIADELAELRIELSAARSPDGIARRPGLGRCCS